MIEYIDLLNFVFNRWNYDKFPKEKPLIFYKGGQPIVPRLGMSDGLKVVISNTIAYIQKEFPGNTLKFWRLQSPRHFYGGDWNQNGTCLFNKPLEENEVCVLKLALILLGFPPANHFPGSPDSLYREIPILQDIFSQISLPCTRRISHINIQL